MKYRTKRRLFVVALPALLLMTMMLTLLISTIASMMSFPNELISFQSSPDTFMGGAATKHQSQHDTQKNPLSRIVLMGQFNYGRLSINSMLTWVHSMKRAGFADVVVRGNFLNETIVNDLVNHGVNVMMNQHVEDDHLVGFFSPYLNLKDVLLLEYEKQQQQPTKQQQSTIDGVLYMHDDALANLTQLSQILLETKSKAFVGTNLGKTGWRQLRADVSFQNPRIPPPSTSDDEERRKRTWIRSMRSMSYRMYPHRTQGMYTDFVGNQSFDDFATLEKHLVTWRQRTLPRCRGGQWKMANDPQAAKYMEQDTSHDGDLVVEEYLQLPPYTQADFLYVPLDHAKEFAELATLTAKHGIWIECAIPMIVDQIMRLHQVESVTMKLCTEFSTLRGTTQMMSTCRSQLPDVYHPFKLDNATSWKDYFEELNEDILTESRTN